MNTELIHTRLFRVPVLSITGGLLSLLALVALIALLLGLPIAGPLPYNWSLFVGIRNNTDPLADSSLHYTVWVQSDATRV